MGTPYLQFFQSKKGRRDIQGPKEQEADGVQGIAGTGRWRSRTTRPGLCGESKDLSVGAAGCRQPQKAVHFCGWAIAGLEYGKEQTSFRGKKWRRAKRRAEANEDVKQGKSFSPACGPHGMLRGVSWVSSKSPVLVCPSAIFHFPHRSEATEFSVFQEEVQIFNECPPIGVHLILMIVLYFYFGDILLNIVRNKKMDTILGVKRGPSPSRNLLFLGLVKCL